MKKWSSSLILSLSMLMLIAIYGCSAQEPVPVTSDSNTGPKEQTEKKSEYPSRQIKIIVPFAAGGGTDAVARVLAESMKNELGTEVIVVNRTGGSGAIGMNEGLHSKGDGYTLTLVTREVVSLPIQGTAPFETMDFKYVANLNADPGVLAVRNDSKFQTLEEFVNAMKERPDEFKLGAGANPYFYASQFATGANVSFKTIPYDGNSLVLTELLGGGIDFGIFGPAEVKAQLEAGTIRALGIESDERFAGLKDVPTMREQGIDVVSTAYRGVAVPPDTPDEIVKILEDAIAKIVADQSFLDFMEKSFLGVSYKSAADFTSMVEDDMTALRIILEGEDKN